MRYQENISQTVETMKNSSAMWSGDRNLSTAMMRSFGNRSDVTSVTDEPFYGAYLKKTNKNHPMIDEIISTMNTSYKSVEQICSTEEESGYSYHKHMSQHIFNYDSLDWVTNSINCFLRLFISIYSNIEILR